MYCPKCGKELLEVKRFCPFCGVPQSPTKDMATMYRQLQNASIEDLIENFSELKPYYQKLFRQFHEKGKFAKFNFAAAVFGPLWALQKRMWASALFGILIYIFSFGLGFIGGFFFYGFFGNGFYYMSLIEGGEDPSDVWD